MKEEEVKEETYDKMTEQDNKCKDNTDKKKRQRQDGKSKRKGDKKEEKNKREKKVILINVKKNLGRTNNK